MHLVLCIAGRSWSRVHSPLKSFPLLLPADKLPTLQIPQHLPQPLRHLTLPQDEEPMTVHLYCFNMRLDEPLNADLAEGAGALPPWSHPFGVLLPEQLPELPEFDIWLPCNVLDPKPYQPKPRPTASTARQTDDSAAAAAATAEGGQQQDGTAGQGDCPAAGAEAMQVG